MKLTIENGLLYIDNKRFCYAKVNDGSKDVRSGARKVSTQYAHNFDRVLPIVADAGFIGDGEECLINVGNVLGSNGPLPCPTAIGGLVARIEAAEDFGCSVLIEVR